MMRKLMMASLLLASLNIYALDIEPKQPNCEVDNASLQAMPLIEVELTRDDGSKHSVPAKLADNNATRAAGFQRVCASTIEAMPILFVFDSEQIPGFHMNNVVAPIDIAFIKDNGKLESIQAMHPYSILDLKKKLWKPKEPVKYALEVHPGFFEKHGLSINSHMRWERKKEHVQDNAN